MRVLAGGRAVSTEECIAWLVLVAIVMFGLWIIAQVTK